MKKLFCGGLSWDTTDESLRAAFEVFGELTEAKVVYDRETNRSKGFGFVAFATEAAAREALEKMDNAVLDGRTIRVSEAKSASRQRS